MGSGRYQASRDATGGVVVAFIGGLMLALFGGVQLEAARDLAAFPDAPRPITVREAAALTEIPRGTWVELVDAQRDCAVPLASDGGGNRYAAVVGGDGSARVVVAMDGTDTPTTCDVLRVGVLTTLEPGRPHGLDWARLTGAAPSINALWTSSGPANSRGLLWGLAPLSAVALALIGGGVAVALGGRARRTVAPFPVPPTALAMPLSTGATAISGLWIMGSVVPVLVFGPLFFAEHLPSFMTLVLGLAWALWFFAVLGISMEAWTTRASDVVLAPEGYAVQGGPLDAVARRWRDDRAGAHGTRAGSDAGAFELLLGGDVAASSREVDETASFARLAETMRLLSAQARGEHAPTAGGPEGAVRCDACGAPVAPADADAVPCQRCAAPVVLRDEVRRQLRGLARLEDARRRAEALVRQLLAQPGARATNVVMLLSAPFLLLGWPVAAVVYDELHQIRRVLGALDGAVIFAAAAGVTYGLGWWVRAQVAGREAIRLVCTQLAAQPPERAGDPAGCRSCGAALPRVAPQALLAVCVYCETENLLGVQLARTERREVAQADALAALLRDRLARRTRLRLASWASLGLVLASGAALYLRFAARL